MRKLITILLVGLFLPLFGQDIPTQVREALETPDTSLLVKAYSVRYYLDSLEQIEDLQLVREDVEYFILDYLPSRYVGQIVEYIEPECTGAYSESTYLNTNDFLYPICFYYRKRSPNNPPANPTDKWAVDIYYKVKIKVFWP